MCHKSSSNLCKLNLTKMSPKSKKFPQKKVATPLNKKIKFKDGEKVLCYQGPYIYEAKCVKKQSVGNSTEYLIHYKGWKSKYDEWVPENRVLIYNEQNLKLQKELLQKSKEKNSKNPQPIVSKNDKLVVEKKNKFKKLTSNENASNTVNSSLKKLNMKTIETPLFVETQYDFLNKQEIKIRIPEELKTILVDDCELITTQNKLLHLPLKLNINNILNDYFIYKSNAKLPANHTIDGYIDFLSGIRKYFNYYLNKCLLYSLELQQFDYLISNYDFFTKDLIYLEQQSNSNKDLRKAAKKHKKFYLKNIDLSSKATTNNGHTDSNTSLTDHSKILSSVAISDNSQSETSDSCTSSENAVNIIENKKDSNSKLSLEQNNPTYPYIPTEADIQTNAKKKIDYTKLYGAVHLLRMFTKLGQFLFYTDLDEERIALLNSYIYDFMKYLSKNLWIFGNDSDTSYIDAHLLLVNKQL